MNRSNDYHVGISDPVRLRRDLLESTREVIHMLQRYERVEDLRAEKREKIKEMHSLFSDIRELSSKLKVIFPKINISSKTPKKIRTTVKPASDLRHLEKELDHIETKLSGLKHG